MDKLCLFSINNRTADVFKYALKSGCIANRMQREYNELTANENNKEKALSKNESSQR